MELGVQFHKSWRLNIHENGSMSYNQGMKRKRTLHKRKKQTCPSVECRQSRNSKDDDKDVLEERGRKREEKEKE